MVTFLKIGTDGKAELVQAENLFDYASSLFGGTHLDSMSRFLENCALIYDDAEKDETINTVASILFDGTLQSMKGTCLLVKVSDTYKCHGCYEGTLPIEQEDVNNILEGVLRYETEVSRR